MAADILRRCVGCFCYRDGFFSSHFIEQQLLASRSQAASSEQAVVSLYQQFHSLLRFLNMPDPVDHYLLWSSWTVRQYKLTRFYQQCLIQHAVDAMLDTTLRSVLSDVWQNTAAFILAVGNNYSGQAAVPLTAAPHSNTSTLTVFAVECPEWLRHFLHHSATAKVTPTTSAKTLPVQSMSVSLQQVEPVRVWAVDGSGGVGAADELSTLASAWQALYPTCINYGDGSCGDMLARALLAAVDSADVSVACVRLVPPVPSPYPGYTAQSIMLKGIMPLWVLWW